ncbi:DUF4352 domain-containing protein [Mycobacterium noviomagense]|uniref:DUF4352 domain-containing protein n=1 Tax=Mycobacterium noviomagense TaxID=459858 RepID=A0A7I7PA40_9MYCO|nr:DUF4352 domain-containing protein [Mycobacterium noviomagense]ORB15908.1 hypothetical protein BST37_08360 [Mycobacterium noviomagense]BBY05439.1 hypothetical protein MNVI_07570 [Mycobacterium noviomagense]
MGVKLVALITSLMLVSGLAASCSAVRPLLQTETKTVTVTVTAAPPSSAWPSPLSPQTTTRAPSAGMGQEAQDGNLAFTVTEVQGPKSGALAVILTIENLGISAQTYVADYQKLIDAQGREFSVDLHGLEEASAFNSQAIIQTDINPGVKLKAVLAFSVPDDVKPAHVVLRESMHSPGVVVNLS